SAMNRLTAPAPAKTTRTPGSAIAPSQAVHLGPSASFRSQLIMVRADHRGAEKMADKRIVVVGAGAIGGYTGGNLAHNGFDVTLVDPWPEHVEAIRRDGLALEGITPEEFVLARPKILHLTEVQHLGKQPPIDIAFISVKSYDTEWATMMIRQYLAPSGYVVSLQNCINEERIAALVGWGKTAGAIAAI